MWVFWLLAALMTAAALAFVLVPLLRSRPSAGPSAHDANLDVLRGQRREIEADVANGILPPASKDEALDELLARAQDDLDAAGKSESAQPAKRPWVSAGIAAVAIPVAAFGIYLANGAPAAADARVASPPAAAPLDDKQIVAMVETLAQKVKDRPDDVQGWALLARSMGALGRFKESAEAYAHLAALTPGDPQVLADFADALGMAQGRSLAGRPYELVKKALAIDPKHKKALALAGTAAIDMGDYPAALGYWQRLAAQLPPDSEDAQQVRAIIGEVMLKSAAAGQVLGAPPKAVAESPAPLAPPASVPAAAAAQPESITGSVAITPAMAARIAGGETLFIFARAENGPRMPLAVVRAPAKSFPTTFALDDSQAMTPTMKLSSAQAVRVEARISRSGNALPQSGDLVGTSVVLKPGARNVAILIDKAVP